MLIVTAKINVKAKINTFSLYQDIEYSFLCYTVVSCTEEINTTLWLRGTGVAVKRYPTPMGKGEVPARW